jgi:hypothetical protein
MKIHSASKINRLKQLRKRGYSINELVEKMHVPKTTVWHHVHRIKVSEKYTKILNSKRGGSRIRKQKNIELSKVEAREILESTNRELAIALSMLYWGEGSKKTCDFINSDGKIIEVYLKIIRGVFKIEGNFIRATMRIFTGMDENDCLNYWSKVTGIRKGEFKVRFNDGGTRGKTKYGMCRISIRKGAKLLKIIHSLIGQIHEEILEK